MHFSMRRLFCKTIIIVFSFLVLTDLIIAQDFWRNIYQSSVRTFSCINISSKNILYAGSGAGIVKSPDNGISWSNPFLAQQDVWSLASNKAGDIYAGTYGSGIYKSSDNGETWNSIGPVGNEIISIAINKDGHILAGTRYGGIFKSTNDGQNWTGLGGPTAYITTILIDTGGYIYAGSINGLYRSTNNGSTWSDINMGLADIYIYSIVIDTNGTLFIATKNAGLYRSTTRGLSWIAVNNGLTSLNTAYLAVNSLGHIFAATRDAGVFRSMDNGEIWKIINTGLSNTNIKALGININGYVFAATAQGMIFRSDKSTTGGIKVIEPVLTYPLNNSLGVSTNLSLKWNASYGATFYTLQVSSDSFFTAPGIIQKEIIDTTCFLSGLNYSTQYYWRVSASSYDNQSKWSDMFSFSTEPEPPKFWQFLSGPQKSNAITVDSNNNLYVGTKVDGIYKSSNGGISWSNVFPYSCVTYCFAVDSINTIYAGVGPGGMFKSTNEGRNWISMELPEEDIHAILITPKKSIIAGSVGKILRSTNSGATWNPGKITPWAITVILAHPLNNLIFASTRWSGVFVSSDDGINWRNVGLIDHALEGMVVNSKGVIYVASEDSGVYCSTNNGGSWSQIFKYSSTPSQYLTALAISPNDNLYFSTSMNGVYRSTDGGLTWSVVNLGLGEDPVILFTLAIDQNGYLYAGSYLKGVYRSIKPTTVSVKNITNSIPDNFLLEQNFPNPFNSTTTIRYSLPADNFVEIKIYDLMGREINTLVNERQPAGKYEVKYQADNIPSGVYFYRLRAGSLCDVKKLMLLK